MQWSRHQQSDPRGTYLSGQPCIRNCPQVKEQMCLSPSAPGCAAPSVLQCLVRLGEEHSCLVCHRELDVLLPDIDYVEIPVDWWNAEADKSLLIGVFKHGMYPAGLVGASVREGPKQLARAPGSGVDVACVLRCPCEGAELQLCAAATQGQGRSPVTSS